MPVLRESPYSAFNFLVELEPGKGKDPQAGFSEVSGLNTEITVAEYRTGNDPVNHVRKRPGIFKTGDVTLKRGVIGAVNIRDWLEAVRNGDVSQAKRDIVIKLLDESRANVVASWKLRSAMPMKWTGPTLSAKGGTDVAMEELVLSVEQVDQE